MNIQEQIIQNCKKLLLAYSQGKLGYMQMPEDKNPGFSNAETELCLTYFTLPMALNYQRNSYRLRESALQTYEDTQTKNVFDIKSVNNMDIDELKNKLIKYKLALQPNKHIYVRKKIASTVYQNRGSFEIFFNSVHCDFLQLKQMIQKDHKKGFPYLSGPKIFNYRSFIIQKYGNIKLTNSQFIDIAPDTHIKKCSVRLGVITDHELVNATTEDIAKKRCQILIGTGIDPINMHSPLWFRSKNNFMFKL